jgi:hypothetical protein
MMPDIFVKDVSLAAVEELARRAGSSGQGVEDVARDLLNSVVVMDMARRLKAIEALRAMNTMPLPDSVAIIRELRDHS